MGEARSKYPLWPGRERRKEKISRELCAGPVAPGEVEPSLRTGLIRCEDDDGWKDKEIRDGG